jgi:hypothetical protein
MAHCCLSLVTRLRPFRCRTLLDTAKLWLSLLAGWAENLLDQKQDQDGLS